MDDRAARAVSEIQTAVGDKRVLVLVSGGVDSSVCAALVSRALGADRVVALHIDNGFMRKNESSLGSSIFSQVEIAALSCRLSLERPLAVNVRSQRFTGRVGARPARRGRISAVLRGPYFPLSQQGRGRDQGLRLDGPGGVSGGVCVV